MQLVYFSRVREQIGCGEETIDQPNTVQTVADLIAFLSARGQNYATALADMSFIRVAVNQVHVPINHPVSNHDEVAFFPPVTGG